MSQLCDAVLAGLEFLLLVVLLLDQSIELLFVIEVVLASVRRNQRAIGPTQRHHKVRVKGASERCILPTSCDPTSLGLDGILQSLVANNSNLVLLLTAMLLVLKKRSTCNQIICHRLALVSLINFL